MQKTVYWECMTSQTTPGKAHRSMWPPHSRTKDMHDIDWHYTTHHSRLSNHWTNYCLQAAWQGVQTQTSIVHTRSPGNIISLWHRLYNLHPRPNYIRRGHTLRNHRGLRAHVCLSVYKISEKVTNGLWWNIFGRVRHGPRKNRLDFGGDSASFVDPGSFSSTPYTLCLKKRH